MSVFCCNFNLPFLIFKCNISLNIRQMEQAIVLTKCILRIQQRLVLTCIIISVCGTGDMATFSYRFDSNLTGKP